MNAALAAEQEARAQVEACRQEAEKKVADARQRARRILERADERIARLHEQCTVDTRRRMQQLLTEEQKMRADLSLRAGVEKLLDSAIEEVATRLATAERVSDSHEEG